eukprot:COSAG04_NODE_1831_length_5458_cov_28.504945_2_plen_46_part_01
MQPRVQATVTPRRAVETRRDTDRAHRRIVRARTTILARRERRAVAV